MGRADKEELIIIFVYQANYEKKIYLINDQEAAGKKIDLSTTEKLYEM